MHLSVSSESRLVLGLGADVLPMGVTLVAVDS
jgi:hypothetical protein